jgi:membrane fusion protein (multidrug efflux system)
VLTTELPGRASAVRIAEVRARVDGVVLKRLFVQGSEVTAGESLFQIDPAPYRAALESAQAQLARAEATATSAKLLAERYARLIRTNAVSRQEYDNAIAQQKAAAADVGAARAAVTTARINVGYTAVRAPIAGQTGRTAVTEGAYVRQGEATLLATVTQLDPIYVDTTLSTSDLLRVRREIASGQMQTIGGKPRVTIVLEDGSVHPQPGTLEVTDVNVDPTTGSVAMRAIVPNPTRELLPGMFVRARVEEGAVPDALLVPQRAVMRDPNGPAYAFVVDNAGKVLRRDLVVDREVDQAWLVTKGIAPGERVIVEGLQKAQPGAVVSARPAAKVQARPNPNAPARPERK